MISGQTRHREHLRRCLNRRESRKSRS